MVETGEGDVIFGSPKLDVTLLADIDQLAVVEVRAAPGWGGTAPHVHARHAEAVFVIEGKVDLRLEDRVHRMDAETWAFVPPEVLHTFEVTGDEQARFLVLHAPGSGYGDYVRGSAATFDQLSPLDVVARDPGLAVVHRAGGSEGDRITDRPERRATVLVEADELTISEFDYGSGERGAPPHVHREHADAFLVVEGEFTFHLRDASHAGRGQLRCSLLAQLHQESTDPTASFVRMTASEEPDLVEIVPPDVRKADDAFLSADDVRVANRVRSAAVNPRAYVLRRRAGDSLMGERASVEEV